MAAAVLLATVSCGEERASAGRAFEPFTPGVLTVATAFLPAPGFWDADRADPAPTAGFEAALAGELADRLGLERVAVVQVPFSDIVAGRFGGADLALSQVTPTEARERTADFTTPYLEAPPGVLARTGMVARDAAGLRDLQWAVARVSTLTPIVTERIRPGAEPIEVEDRAAALELLRAGRVDAVLLDLPVAQGLERAEPGRFRVLGHVGGGEGLAAVLPEGSPNREIVDSAVRAMGADGTLARLVGEWLGEEADRVRLIRLAD